MPQANSHTDGVKASAVSAKAVSAVPAASSGPAVSRDSRCPLTALAITVAAVPSASRTPRAATGSWKLPDQRPQQAEGGGGQGDTEIGQAGQAKGRHGSICRIHLLPAGESGNADGLAVHHIESSTR